MSEKETKQAPKRRRAVLEYVAILFGAALVLVAISLLVKHSAPQVKADHAPTIVEEAASAENETHS
ncbi:MAG: hypothetical protein CW335_02640 [Clostridiales bacterium]|nr:hypothetical protein [Clostridiales bacterium]